MSVLIDHGSYLIQSASFVVVTVIDKLKNVN